MFNVRVEYESTPIRHIAVQCPECSNWFNGWEITERKRVVPFEILRYKHDISFVEFECPICGNKFGGLRYNDKPKIEEVGYPEIYEGCLKREETWK